MGLAFGTWVVGSTMIAEMFGTNLRATAATTIPNFCRGSTIVINLLLLSLKPYIGIWGAVSIAGAIVFTLAIASLLAVKESYGRELYFTNAG